MTTSPPLGIRSIHHVSFTIGDMDRSLAFYRNLGFEVSSDRRNLDADYLRDITCYDDVLMHVAFLKGYNVLLELIQYVRPQGIDLDKTNYNIGSAHLCFEVEDIYAAYECLRLSGVVFRSPPVEIHQGPNAGRGAVYFQDPDGYTLEFSALLKNS
jgi:catechol 2,3-dioxygenase-like lactoylglutathione lyase family enzyme